jgi:hypothetical protein
VRTKNLFLIGRSRVGLEDQLTEMLAYLWQEEPDLIDSWLRAVGIHPPGVGVWEVATQVVDKKTGRFDLVLTKTDEAQVIVESKLGSDVGDRQLERYVDFLGRQREPLRALVTLTESRIRWREELEQSANALGVTFVAARWQEFASRTADPSEDSLAGDFVRMLIAGGLVTPDAVVSSDWTRWNEGVEVLSRLEVLLGEARPDLERLAAGLKATGRYGLSTRWIYRLLSNEAFTLGVGFAANHSSRKPESRPIIFAPVKNLLLNAEDSKERAAEAARAAEGRVLWGDYPYVWRPVEEVLTTSEFREQVAETVAFVYETAAAFQAVGYLPDVPLSPPSGVTIMSS